MFNTNNERRITKLAEKTTRVAEPFSDMLRDAQLHANNLLLFEQDLDQQIEELQAQKVKVVAERVKNDQFVDKLNKLFE